MPDKITIGTAQARKNKPSGKAQLSVSPRPLKSMASTLELSIGSPTQMPSPHVCLPAPHAGHSAPWLRSEVSGGGWWPHETAPLNGPGQQGWWLCLCGSERGRKEPGAHTADCMRVFLPQDCTFFNKKAQGVGAQGRP